MCPSLFDLGKGVVPCFSRWESTPERFMILQVLWRIWYWLHSHKKLNTLFKERLHFTTKKKRPMFFFSTPNIFGSHSFHLFLGVWFKPWKFWITQRTLFWIPGFRLWVPRISLTYESPQGVLQVNRTSFWLNIICIYRKNIYIYIMYIIDYIHVYLANYVYAPCPWITGPQKGQLSSKPRFSRTPK